MLQFGLLRNTWRKLTPNTQILVSFGVPLILAAALYFCFIAPYQEEVVRLGADIKNNKKILSEMQLLSEKINTMAGAADFSRHASALEMMSIIQRSIKSASLSVYLVELKQDGVHAVTASFEGVSFDALSAWMISLWNEDAVVVEKIQVDALTKSQGLVNAKLRLSL